MGSVVSVVPSSKESQETSLVKAQFAKYDIQDVKSAFKVCCSLLDKGQLSFQQRKAGFRESTESSAAPPAAAPSTEIDLTSDLPFAIKRKRASLRGINANLNDFYSIFGPGSLVAFDKPTLCLPFEVFTMLSKSSRLIPMLELFLVLSLYSTGEIRERVRFCFQVFDDDESGALDQAEVRTLIQTMLSVLYKLGDLPTVPDESVMDAAAAAIFKTVDKDSSGVIDADEFHSWASQSTSCDALMKKLERLAVFVDTVKRQSLKRIDWSAPSSVPHPYQFSVTSLASKKSPKMTSEHVDATPSPVSGVKLPVDTSGASSHITVKFQVVKAELVKLHQAVQAAEAVPAAIMEALKVSGGSTDGKLKSALMSVLATGVSRASSQAQRKERELAALVDVMNTETSSSPQSLVDELRYSSPEDAKPVAVSRPSSGPARRLAPLSFDNRSGGGPRASVSPPPARVGSPDAKGSSPTSGSSRRRPEVHEFKEKLLTHRITTTLSIAARTKAFPTPASSQGSPAFLFPDTPVGTSPTPVMTSRSSRSPSKSDEMGKKRASSAQRVRPASAALQLNTSTLRLLSPSSQAMVSPIVTARPTVSPTKRTPPSVLPKSPSSPTARIHGLVDTMEFTQSPRQSPLSRGLMHVRSSNAFPREHNPKSATNIATAVRSAGYGPTVAWASKQ